MREMVQIADSQDLIGPAQPIEELIEEYAKEDQIYRHKLQVLSSGLFDWTRLMLFWLSSGFEIFSCFLSVRSQLIINNISHALLDFPLKKVLYYFFIVV